MKLLLTGATGYIGKRLLPVLVDAGHKVVCCVRDRRRFSLPSSIRHQVSVIEIDLLDEASLAAIPKDIDAAYYLVHSMSASDDYQELEKRSAINFRNALATTRVQQVIYLSGIVNESNLSKHLSSRKAVENELSEGSFSLTTLRAGIIIGSGSASFEIIRDLVEKLPLMITPKWLKTRCQPIGVSDVLSFLSKSLLNPKTYDQSFDIGGPDILTYKQMLLGFAEKRGLKRVIWVIPVMSPRLSSYWLYFVTSTSYRLAVSLVNSMKVEVVCRNNDLNRLLGIEPVGYMEALGKAFQRIESNSILSSWKDAYSSSGIRFNISDFIEVPTFGCFVDKRERQVDDVEMTLDKIWSIGGSTGWYYANRLWKLRGFLDKMAGGVGLRRGRTNVNSINTGDSVDFWRVLYADRKEGRLLLFAEMKLPGEAWLEFKLKDKRLEQTATFRPRGLWGRLYWYAVLPFHGLIFSGMIHTLAKTDKT
ncbi:SDR family oxidoreductase [Algoriphagus sp. H41]|uniref:SDR family oxidoreductase n=1 Tax=Algoriphagus oliviformis TaxID=2811231 RepID=A0ABS3C7S7_9BACT|nr:SDR family oxidoreductase [Algoriphagus oliviformis]MBN7812200.1 SDR family oxidoreductase [Algoriphagus oliviformis]